MDKKKLEAFRKKLETRRNELRQMVVRNQQDGRTADDEATQDVADRAASSYSARAITIGSCSTWSMGLLLAFAKAALGNASLAAKRSMPSVSKPCLGLATASSARKKPRRVCSKPRNNAQ